MCLRCVTCSCRNGTQPAGCLSVCTNAACVDHKCAVNLHQSFNANVFWPKLYMASLEICWPKRFNFGQQRWKSAVKATWHCSTHTTGSTSGRVCNVFCFRSPTHDARPAHDARQFHNIEHPEDPLCHAWDFWEEGVAFVWLLSKIECSLIKLLGL